MLGISLEHLITGMVGGLAGHWCHAILAKVWGYIMGAEKKVVEEVKKL